VTIIELIALLENQIRALNDARIIAVRLGDVSRVMEIDAKIAETEATLAALKGL
jgi:hypothetical protein